MAPIKFEKDIKEKMERRKLQPSANAWETLQKRLDENEAKEDNEIFWWFSIAASFVGILIIASMFFDNRDKKDIEPALVDEEQYVPINKKDVINPIEKEIKVAVEKFKEPTIIKSSKNKQERKTRLQQNQKELINTTTKEVVAQTEKEEKDVLKESVTKSNVKLSYEDQKIQEVVAKVQQLKNANNTVSDAEINLLLDQAQKDISLYKLYNKITQKVDANALLQDVEADLEQSFRDRAFKAIKSGYNYVKTAVAERNN